jgi:ADP-ribosylglycohydrolase
MDNASSDRKDTDAMTDAPIDGCKLRFECPMRWDTLERVGKDPNVRFCGQCQSAVHWTASEAEAMALGRQGKCVALGFVHDHPMGEPLLGGFDPVGLSADAAEAGLWGLLVGDAVGVPYEFHPPTALPAIELIDVVPPRSFSRAHVGVPVGTWSDDGAQALALLDTLIATGDVDLRHFADNLRAWLHEGRFAVNRSVFDVGRQTATAINRLVSGCPPEKAGPSTEQDNSNGALMRVFPLLMLPWLSSSEMATAAVMQCRVTHGHPRSHVACIAFCFWVDALQRLGSARSWAQMEERMRDGLLADDLELPEDEIELVLNPDCRKNAGGTGYVVDTLWSARIAVEETSDYASCIRRAIAFGHDTDTTAAVAGAAAGVLYGLEGIPLAWREALRGKDILVPLIERYRIANGEHA